VWVRMSTLQGSPNQSDEEIAQVLKVLRENILPAARQMDGYKGVISVGDRSNGKGVTLTFWETEEAMQASEEAANKLRQQAADEMDEEISGVERFEVYINEPPQA
jgi:heme-degrading monooxygenase HmoA